MAPKKAVAAPPDEVPAATKKAVAAPPDEVPAAPAIPAAEEPSVPGPEAIKKRGRGRPAGGSKGARGDKTKARKKKRYESFSFSLN